MTDLTEQWKARELKTGFYYVYLKCLEMFDIAGSSTLYEILERGNEDSTEVIAPVPSYEENQQLKEEIKKLKEVIHDLDGLECPKCGNYHRRGWTCSQCGYGK